MPSVKPGESQKDYVSRCIPYMMKEKPDMKSDQAAAVCYSLYKKHESIENLIGRMNEVIIKLEEKCKKKKKVVSEAGAPKKIKGTCPNCGEDFAVNPKATQCPSCNQDIRKAMKGKKPVFEEKKEKDPKCHWKGCNKKAERMDKDEYPLCKKHYDEQLKQQRNESAKPQEQPCEVCGKPLGNEAFLGKVHGKCARKKHKEAIGKK